MQKNGMFQVGLWGILLAITAVGTANAGGHGKLFGGHKGAVVESCSPAFFGESRGRRFSGPTICGAPKVYEGVLVETYGQPCGAVSYGCNGAIGSPISGGYPSAQSNGGNPFGDTRLDPRGVYTDPETGARITVDASGRITNWPGVYTAGLSYGGNYGGTTPPPAVPTVPSNGGAVTPPPAIPTQVPRASTTNFQGFPNGRRNATPNFQPFPDGSEDFGTVPTQPRNR